MPCDAGERDAQGNSAEDFFSDSLAGVFDEVQVQHGEPGGVFDYESSQFGTLRLRLTASDDWEETLKFAHHVWNGELSLAQDIDTGRLCLQGLDVLELGAGTGLAGILAALTGARNVVFSDYPATAIIATLRDNVTRLTSGRSSAQCHVVGHAWGQPVAGLTDASSHGVFDAVLLADCLWMPELHDALLDTIRSCLAPGGRVFCVAGFHSGRRKMAPFFDAALGRAGLVAVSLFEEDHRGARRSWDPARAEEE